MSLADEPQLAGIAGRIADVIAEADAERMRELDAAIAAGKDEATPICPCGCLAPLGKCAAKARPPPRPEPVVKTFTRPAPGDDVPAGRAPSPAGPPPASPAQETTMACPECKNPGRHKATCSKNPEKKAAPAAKVAPAPAKVTKLPAPKGPARSGDAARSLLADRENLDAMEFEDLIDLRAEVERAIDRRIAARERELEALRAAKSGARAESATA